MPGPFRIANRRARFCLTRVISRMPLLVGSPIDVRFRPELTMYAGELRSAAGQGTAVHAGSDLRRREIILDSELISIDAELRRIFAHEAHHFIWFRLGNPRRHGWEALIDAEIRARRLGELGWSAQIRKERLSVADRTTRKRRWRDYVCESFCDTAAWLYAGVSGHEEFTLATAASRLRENWFEAFMRDRTVRI